MSEAPPDDAAATESSEEQRSGVGSLFYKVALAGVGGVMLAQEEIANLLRRKSDDESPGEGEAGDSGDSGASQAPPEPTGVEVTIDRVLHTLHLPSRADVDALSRALDELERRVETLRRKQGA